MDGLFAQLRYRMRGMIKRPRFDMPLAGALLLLGIIGLMTQYSASDLDRDKAIAQGLRGREAELDAAESGASEPGDHSGSA